MTRRTRRGSGTPDVIALTGVLLAMATAGLAMGVQFFELEASQTLRAIWGGIGGLGALIAAYWVVRLLQWGILHAKGEDTLMFGGFIAFILGPPAGAAVVGLMYAIA